LFKLNGMQKEVFRCKLGRVDFLKTGSAAKVVFVHGIADRKEAFEPICDALAGSYPCFSLDLPAKVFGSGTSNQSIVEQIASLILSFFVIMPKKRLYYLVPVLGPRLLFNWLI